MIQFRFGISHCLAHNIENYYEIRQNEIRLSFSLALSPPLSLSYIYEDVVSEKKKSRKSPSKRFGSLCGAYRSANNLKGETTAHILII